VWLRLSPLHLAHLSRRTGAHMTKTISLSPPLACESGSRGPAGAPHVPLELVRLGGWAQQMPSPLQGTLRGSPAQTS
jgi:hypothetical protein